MTISPIALDALATVEQYRRLEYPVGVDRAALCHAAVILADEFALTNCKSGPIVPDPVSNAELLDDLTAMAYLVEEWKDAAKRASTLAAAKLSDIAKDRDFWECECKMWIRAVTRELDGYWWSKTHLIDAAVLSIKSVVDRLKAYDKAAAEVANKHAYCANGHVCLEMSAPVVAWQPITTLKKPHEYLFGEDPTMLFVNQAGAVRVGFLNRWEQRVHKSGARMKEEFWCRPLGFSNDEQATHWMPLPKAP